ncbi:alanine racemase [Paraburkholderia sp.]|uniref:alanine racemase n=1 Tax=Paraburkholderia sp. TaxID=1926495 RepID=UPI0039E5FD9C
MTTSTLAGFSNDVDSFPAWAEIDLDALGRNFDLLKARVGADRQIIVPVKANAYGHGAVSVARHLAARGAYAVQTACVRDAVEIRRSGNPVRIVTYPGDLRADLSTLLQHDIVPSVVDLDGARHVSDTVSRPTAIYVKIDAGLQRLGVLLEHAEDVVMRMAALPNLSIDGLYTHLPISDMRHAAWARSRIRAFEALVLDLERRGLELPMTQARASAHVMARIDDGLSAVCAGHLLYGLSPFATSEAIDFPTKPVLGAFRSRLIQVRPTGKSCTETPYGGDFRNVETTGVIPVGRAHGVRRPLKQPASAVLVAGRPARILSVTLEYTVIDLTDHPNVRPGEIVTLLGDDGDASLSLDDVATRPDCTPLDFCIGLRGVAFRYRGAR